MLVAKTRYALPANQTFNISRIVQAKACDGVRAAYPVYIERPRAVWEQPGGRGYPIRVISCEPSDHVLLIPEVAQFTDPLKQSGAALVDEKNKSVYGPPGSRAPWNQWHGVTLASRSIYLVGTFRLGTDFANDGNLFMDPANFARFFPSRAPGRDPLEVVDLGVVQLDKGADTEKVKTRLAARLPDDVAVFTKAEMIDASGSFGAIALPSATSFWWGR